MKELGSKVFGDYRIASLPYDSKEEAYQAIRETWSGQQNCTTWYSQEDHQWYIVIKN